MSDPRPGIRVDRDGPYEVTGSTPLMRGRIVKTEFGEPVAWDIGPQLYAGKNFRLCRCGQSSDKPFCDDTHEKDGFVGTEVADRAPTATRRTAFKGEGVELTDDLSLCSHAGFCKDRFTGVWEMMEEAADPEIREQLEHMVSLCPSGRLAYSDPPGEGDVEPKFEASIVIEADGPLWARGSIPVTSADGSSWEIRNRVTLCRCGRSGNKPFCDGTHEKIGFKG